MPYCPRTGDAETIPGFRWARHDFQIFPLEGCCDGLNAVSPPPSPTYSSVGALTPRVAVFAGGTLSEEVIKGE